MGEGADTAIFRKTPLRMAFALFSFLVALLTALQSHAYTLGKVEEVSDVGQIRLDTGEAFSLWGLAPMDSERFRAALLGRSIYCADFDVGFDVIRDCFLFPRNEKNRSTPLRALEWLPELGLARLQCNGDFELAVDGGPYGIGQGSYACRDGQVEFLGAHLHSLSVSDLRKILKVRYDPQTTSP